MIGESDQELTQPSGGEYIYFGGEGGPRRKCENVTDPVIVRSQPIHSSLNDAKPEQSYSNNYYYEDSGYGIDSSATDYMNATELDMVKSSRMESTLKPLSITVEPDAVTTTTRGSASVQWTSPDSSYGAAFPCCGFIPKKTRRIIELFILGLGSFLVIYILIKFTVIITSGVHKNTHTSTNSTGGSKYLETDDDFYVTNEAENDDNWSYFNYMRRN